MRRLRESEGTCFKCNMMSSSNTESDLSNVVVLWRVRIRFIVIVHQARVGMDVRGGGWKGRDGAVLPTIIIVLF